MTTETPAPPFLRVVSSEGMREGDIAYEMVERIKDVVYDYADRATLVAAIGALEIAKMEILTDHRED